MRCTPFRMYLLVTGIFSLGFQIAGIIVEAWKRMRFELYKSGSINLLTINTGLWTTSYCVDYGIASDEECARDVNNVVLNINGGTPDTKQFLAVKVLSLVGSIWALGALCITVVFFCQQDKRSDGKCGAILGALSWGIDAILALASVAIAVHLYLSMKASVKHVHRFGVKTGGFENYEVFFPWAIVLTSIGAFLAIISGISLALKLCRTSQYY